MLVRTTSWMLLQRNQGVVNDTLVAASIVANDSRIQYNQTGTIVAMVHILLPFMVLPLYSVMPDQPDLCSCGACSLGATSWTFRRIYVLPLGAGMGAGGGIARLHSGGRVLYHARAGGRCKRTKLFSNFIAFHMQSLNWSLAAALCATALAGILLLYGFTTG
jgi:putative spermidine/putrescine transport system permease protein